MLDFIKKQTSSALHTQVNRFKYHLLAALILLSSFGSVKAQLSPSASISILTCSQGDELYSIFGHTAIRVNDIENGIDYVFNYGTFNFSTPNFYLKFARGHLNYMLSVSTFNRFINEYQYEKRSVWEQIIDLSSEQKNELYQSLIENTQPENRYYQYHFFFDNCATRVRDMVEMHIPGGVNYQIPDYVNQMTFRQAIGTYLQENLWIELGLAIILGEPTDDKVDESTVQFLPDFLMWQFDSATKKIDNSPIIHTKTTLLEFEESSESKTITPFWGLFFVALFILLLTLITYRNKTISKWIDFAIFSTTTILGLLLFFLWFFTSHSVTGPNWHLLWANPFHLLVVISLFKNHKLLKVSTVIIAMAILTCLLFFVIIPQYMPLALIPIWVILFIRICLQLSYQYKLKY